MHFKIQRTHGHFLRSEPFIDTDLIIVKLRIDVYHSWCEDKAKMWYGLGSREQGKIETVTEGVGGEMEKKSMRRKSQIIISHSVSCNGLTKE